MVTRVWLIVVIFVLGFLLGGAAGVFYGRSAADRHAAAEWRPVVADPLTLFHVSVRPGSKAGEIAVTVQDLHPGSAFWNTVGLDVRMREEPADSWTASRLVQQTPHTSELRLGDETPGAKMQNAFQTTVFRARLARQLPGTHDVALKVHLALGPSPDLNHAPLQVEKYLPYQPARVLADGEIVLLPG